ARRGRRAAAGRDAGGGGRPDGRAGGAPAGGGGERGRAPPPDDPPPAAAPPAAAGGRLPDAFGVAGGPEVEHALEVEPGDREPTVPRPGRDQGHVVGEPFAPCELDDLRGRVDAFGRRAGPGLDVVVGVPAGRPQGTLLARL